MKRSGYRTNVAEKYGDFTVMISNSTDFSLGILNDVENTVLTYFGNRVADWRPIPAKD